MSYKEFTKDLQGDTLPNIMILWGKETFLSDWAARAVEDRYATEVSRQFDVLEFDGNEADFYRIEEACETLPLFSERKVIVVEDPPSLGGRSAAPGEDSLTAYMKDPSPTTCLVLVCGEKIDKRKAMYKTAVKTGKIYEFTPLAPPDLKKWIRKRIRSHKKQIPDRELQQMIDQSGYYDRDSDYSLYHFENDISKVVLHSETDTITAEDVRISMSGNADTNVFALIDHLGKGNKKAAFDMLTDMFLYGENEYRILALLSGQFEKILGTKQLLAEGKNRKQIAQILGARDFQVDRFLNAGRKYSEEELKKILEKIYSSDKKIKSGDMDSRIALELLIGEL